MSRFSKLFGFGTAASRGVTWSELRGTAFKVVRYGCYIHVCREYVLEYSVCVGPSMLPTLQPRGDVLLHEKASIMLQRVQVGDVVIAASPRNPRHIICKRVLGLEGDTVRVPVASRDGSRTVKVPEGHVWLQGDNTLNSTDSRHYGPVPYALLKGRAIVRFRWLPPFKVDLVRTVVPQDVSFPMRDGGSEPNGR